MFNKDKIKKIFWVVIGIVALSIPFISHLSRPPWIEPGDWDAMFAPSNILYTLCLFAAVWIVIKIFEEFFSSKNGKQ